MIITIVRPTSSSHRAVIPSLEEPTPPNQAISLTPTLLMRSTDSNIDLDYKIHTVASETGFTLNQLQYNSTPLVSESNDVNTEPLEASRRR